VITLKGLAQLSERTVEARRRIADTFERSAVQVNGHVAWGQFLDAPRKAGQYGIYGTSAAIQVLSASGHSVNSPLISKALTALPALHASDQATNFYDADDLSITFKNSAILEAAQPGEVEFKNEEPAEKLLLGQLLEGHGWGNYHDATDEDDSPRLLPTAHALLALRRSRHFRGSEVCESVLRWLCDATKGNPAMAIHEAAMVLLALTEYEAPGVQLPTYSSARARLVDLILHWGQARPKDAFGETASYHYWVQSGQNQHNHYVYYVPDILAALSLLVAGNPRPGRAMVAQVVERLCSEIARYGGFQARTSRRIATVDQLWAFHLLERYNIAFQHNPANLISPLAYYASASPARRAITSFALLAVGTAGTLLSALSHLNLAARTAGGVLAVVALAIFASLLFVWIRGE
jgi:hypothetical protein